jgi:hypothetical protein
MQASQFYTGLGAEMYDLLASYQAPVSFFAELICNNGEPAAIRENGKPAKATDPTFVSIASR